MSNLFSGALAVRDGGSSSGVAWRTALTALVAERRADADRRRAAEAAIRGAAFVRAFQDTLDAAGGVPCGYAGVRHPPQWSLEEGREFCARFNCETSLVAGSVSPVSGWWCLGGDSFSFTCFGRAPCPCLLPLAIVEHSVIRLFHMCRCCCFRVNACSLVAIACMQVFLWDCLCPFLACTFSAFTC